MSLHPFYQNFLVLRQLERRFLLQLILCGAGIIFLLWLMVFIDISHAASFSEVLYCWAGITLCTPLLYFSAIPIIRSLIDKKTPHFSTDIYLLVTLIVSYSYSVYVTFAYTERCDTYFDSILMILFSLYTGRYLEVFSTHRIAKLSKNLHAFSSKKVKILKADQQFHEVNFKDVALHDILHIAPGEYIPVDGIIQEGDTSVDESMLTGEMQTVPKFAQDSVRAGTYNLDKIIIIKATSSFEESYLGKILFSIKTSQHPKYHVPFPNDYFNLWYHIITVSMAAAIYCWWLPFDSEFALLSLMSTLLISCPCTIAIIYPLTLSYALDACIKKGILIKNSSAFLKLSDVQHILFDKTGTLTEGQLVVSDIELLNLAKQDEILPLIAAIEKSTHHPIAYAIYDYVKILYPLLPSPEITRLRVFPGKGVRALVNDQFILIGSAHWLKKNGVFISADIIAQQEEKQDASDRIFVHCAIGGIEVARIQLKDKVRHHAQALIADLKSKRLDLTILSGDHPAIVQAVAKQIGPISVAAQALPQKKEAQITDLQDQGKTIAMVGDGLNDALALRQADVGIAIGTGNPIAIFCSDIILETPNLALIEECFTLSKKTQQRLKQNYLLALGLSGVLLPFAALGKLTPIMILSSLSFSALIIMANARRLRFTPSSPKT